MLRVKKHVLINLQYEFRFQLLDYVTPPRKFECGDLQKISISQDFALLFVSRCSTDIEVDFSQTSVLLPKTRTYIMSSFLRNEIQ